MFPLLKQAIQASLIYLWNKTSWYIKLPLIMLGAPAGIIAVVLWWHSDSINARILSFDTINKARIERMETIHHQDISYLKENIEHVRKQNDKIYDYLIDNPGRGR